MFDAFANSSARQTAEVAQQVARRSCAAVWDKVHTRVLAMSVSEARGYIRAHAADVVELEAANSGAAWERRGEVAMLARERVVETLASEVERMHRTRFGLRRAA
jgi:hypothetical protein